MLTALRYLMLLAVVVWVGGIIFFAGAVAPVVFSVLPTRHLAGVVVAASLSRLHLLGLIAGIVFLASSMAAARHVTGSTQWASARTGLVLAMLALTLVSQYAVTPRMHAVRTRIETRATAIDELALSDVDRQHFDRLHKLSVQLETVVLALGLITIYTTVKFPG